MQREKFSGCSTLPLGHGAGCSMHGAAVTEDRRHHHRHDLMHDGGAAGFAHALLDCSAGAITTTP